MTDLIHNTDSLRSKRRFIDAGRVLLDYGRDVEAAVEALVEGSAFAEAIRLVGICLSYCCQSAANS